MVQVKVADPVAPALSWAVTVTEQAHAVVGVPVIEPVVELMDRPAGRPVADHETMVAVDDESVAELVSVLMAEPDTWVWAPGFVTVTVLVMFQVKVVEPK
jgi:Rieske Fe-S protein